MASIRQKQRKDGSIFYEISVSRGHGLSPYTMRWDRPEGLAGKTVNARLQAVAFEFERNCRDGKVKTRKEKKAEEEEAAQKKILEERNKLTFQKFCEETFLPDMRLRCSEHTVYNYQLQLAKHIYPDIGALELQAIRAGDINQLLRKRQTEGTSLSIPVKVYTIIRSILKMAYKDELIDRNPMDKVDRPHKRKDMSQTQSPMACTADELKKLCEALKSEPFLWQVLVRLLIDSGMRIGECIGLLWKNVDFKQNRITVDGTMVYTPDRGVFRDLTKNGKSRTFGVDTEVMEMLGNEVLCRKNLLTGEEKTVLSVAHRRIGKVVFDRDYAVVEAFNITANGIPDEIMILNLSSGEVTRLSKRLIEKLLLENKKSKEKTESGNKNCQKAANIRNETASEEEMNKRGLYRVTFQGPKFISYRTFQGIPHTTSPDKKVIDGYVFIEPENDKQNSSKGYDPFYDSGHYWPQESDKLLDFLDYWDTGWAVEPIPEPELDYNDSHKNQDDYDT